MAEGEATSRKSPWAAVGAVGALLAGVAAVLGVWVQANDGSPGDPAPITPVASPDEGLTDDPTVPSDDTTVPDDGASSPGTARVTVAPGDDVDLDDGGVPDLTWDGFTATFADSRLVAAPPAPTTERCRAQLDGAGTGTWVVVVGATTGPQRSCVETAEGAVLLTEVAYGDQGVLEVAWSTAP